MENTNKTELVFAEGINFYTPRENAPKTIKLNLVIDIPKLMEFAEKHEVKGQLRIDLRKSETKGTFYGTLNNWKPKPVEPDMSPSIDPISGGNSDLIPF